jgi:hypothetical protein
VPRRLDSSIPRPSFAFCASRMVLRDRTEQADFFWPSSPPTVISDGAGRFLLPHSLLRMRRPAQREISLLLHFAFEPLRFSLSQFPGMDRTSHVYFMGSKSGVIYLGVTSNLPIRVGQHKEKILPGFTLDGARILEDSFHAWRPVLSGLAGSAVTCYFTRNAK